MGIWITEEVIVCVRESLVVSAAGATCVCGGSVF